MSAQSSTSSLTALQKTPIAIIGMSALFAKAKNLQEYWQNILGKVNGITEVPESAWNLEDYYDPDPKAPDKTYGKWGGFLPKIDFSKWELIQEEFHLKDEKHAHEFSFQTFLKR